MAITADVAIKNILKVWYKDGVENLLWRNSPVLKKVEKTKVEGKEQAFAAIYSRGGAVAADFLVAEKKASQNVKNAEFKVTPGQLFSVFAYNAKEVQASLSRRGAYMKVAGNKAFAATEALRKTLAAALYGRGYGEIGIYSDVGTVFTTAAAKITLPEDAIGKIDIGSEIEFKTALNGSAVMKATVDGIDDNKVTITPAAGYTTVGGEYIVLAGSTDASGNPLMPMGLDGWLPIVNGRADGVSDTKWSSYIGTPFYNVTRSVAPDRLAGQFYMQPYVDGKEKKSDAVTALLKKCRRAGGNPDMIIMNDEDWYELAKDIETTNTLFTQTSEKGKKKATMGFSDFAAAFSTNWIDNIYDDPYCPKGKFYILDSAYVEYFVYTNAEKVNDGVADNEPGKADPMSADDAGKEDASYKLLIDDFLTVEPGTATSDGPAVRATMNFFGSLAITNPSVCGVGIFATQTPGNILGYN